MIDLRCIGFLDKDNSQILVAGCQSVMYKIDVERGQIIQEMPTLYQYMILKYCHYVCAATTTGGVQLLDPESLSVVKEWQAHTNKLSDMDAQNNFLVTCGWSNRPYGPPTYESFAKVYDLRKLQQLPPIPFQGGAAFVQMHPKMSTTSIIGSTRGQIQVVDLMNPNTSNLHQASVLNSMTRLTLAPSGAAWAIADQGNVIQIWGNSRSKLHFSESQVATEFGDDTVPLPPMAFDSDAPFSTIGMPFYKEKLLSAWSEDLVYEVGFVSPKIDPDVIKHMTPTSIGLRAPNPRKTLRNQATKLNILDSNGTAIVAPKFLSERARDSDESPENRRRISDAESFAEGLAGSTKADVPVMYRLMEIKYSRYGVDDFDFRYYNKTEYSGLETHITNSYLNPLLQLFRFTPLFRNLALHHAASGCISEGCLLCELGFLFDMLEKAEGEKCHATNFLKAFSSIPDAKKLQITEETSPQNTLEVRIQSANRFILNQVVFDYRGVALDDSKLYQNLNHRIRNPPPTFSRVLEESFKRESNPRVFCDKCRTYRQVFSCETVDSVPPVLVLNTGLHKQPEGKQLWCVKGWLPERIGISVENGKVMCSEGERLRNLQNRHIRQLTIYNLVGLVADVNSGDHQKPHMVSLIDGFPPPIVKAESQWHLFNDFLVRPVEKKEALHFATTWKMPTVLIYQHQSASNAIDDTWKQSLDTTCLFQNWSLNPYEVARENWPAVLDPAAESPGPGTYIPIDTEFVRLQQEEIEILASGDRNVIRPTREGLARVSVLRGSGPDEGVSFINDYISISEPVVDYVTKYSGVTAEDLDPQRSHHPLVPLKVAYKKLWLLLNLGCIFVGHGLIKDFRNVNMFVPKDQVVDTVTLFYNPSRSKRNLSLRFLAWYLLKENIQSQTHDSIEDAWSALRLWKKYEEFKDAGIVEKMIDEIYTAGRKYNYRVPEKREERYLGLGTSGRETPDAGSGVSGPTTPVGKKAGANEYFESPGR
ncbi:MAG: hypothetical protein LQ342_006736 [Letrouitia transgressa]|nr:MAG: hypothetical protein LQ342_006736 [Letrouitia transgressa]